MTDKLSMQEESIIQRLRSLKSLDAVYPPASLKKRRIRFRMAATGMIFTAPVLALLKKSFEFLSHLSTGVMGGLLVVSLVVAASLDAYLFRDRITDLLHPGGETPNVVISSGTPASNHTDTLAVETALPSTHVSATPTSTFTATPTPTLTPTLTPSLTFKPQGPSEDPLSTDQGHHYGQTKTPRP